MCRGIILLGYFVFHHVFLSDSVQSHVHVDSAKACAIIHCDRTEHCINRKFWCKNPPCPRMLYCSKTPRESVKGPMTCESVRCSKGYICHVRIRRCRWDQKCEHQIARCVPELEYYDRPASCADSHCPPGHQCILEESLCSYPPCKLHKSCAQRRDVQIWHGRCRALGCPSEYECFLRRPPGDCSSTNSCKHTPDCTVTDVKEIPVDPYCSGWVCPSHQECSVLIPKSCNLDDGIESCRVSRTCREPLANLDWTSSPVSARLIPPAHSTIAGSRDGNSQTDNPKRSQISTQSDHRQSNYHPDPSTKLSTAPAVKYTRKTTPSKTDCDLAKIPARRSRNMQFDEWNLSSDSIHRTPVYLRSAVNRDRDEVGESPRENQSIDRSATQWLDDFRSKTGVDALRVWAKHAEQDRKYEFIEWLAALEIALGSPGFKIWMEEIRKLTSQYPAFQKWLPASSGTEHQIHNGNSTRQDILKVISDQKHQSQLQIAPGHDFTEAKVVNGYGVLKAHKPWAWRYDKPGISDNVQVQDELEQIGDEQKLEELEEWLATFANSQPMKGLPMERTTTPTSNVPKQLYRGTVRSTPKQGVPVDLSGFSQFGRGGELDPLGKSGNDRSVFPMDHDPWNLPTRKNVGHPRINYGRSPAAELRNGTPAWYRTNNFTDELQTQIHETDEEGSKIIHVDSPQIQNKFENVTPVELSDQENNNVRNPSAVECPVNSTVKLQKNMLNYPALQNGTGSENLQGPDVLIDQSVNPERNTNDQKPRGSNNSKQFPEEGQNDSSNASKSPESNKSENYEGVQEFDQSGRSGNSLPDSGMEQKYDLTRMYNLFPPAVDELRIMSPWDVASRKRTYFTILGFSPKQVTEQLQLIGYPVMVSGAASIDQSNGFSQNTENLYAQHSPVDITPYLESNVDRPTTNPMDLWSQILQHQEHPPMTQNFDQAQLQDQKQRIDSRGRQAWLQSQHGEQSSQDQEPPNVDSPVGQQVQEIVKEQNNFPDNRLKHVPSLVAPNELTGQLPRVLLIDGTSEPIQRFFQSQDDNSYRRMNWVLRDSEDSVPTGQEEETSPRFEQQSPVRPKNSLDNWYQWHGRTPKRRSEVSRVTLLDPFLGEEGFKDYSSTLSSQEYVDAYVNAFIEDALSEIILSEQLDEDEGPADHMNPRNLGSNAHDHYAATYERFDEGQYDIDTDQGAQQITTTPSPSSTIVEINDQHGCGNSKMNPAPTKSLANGEEYAGEYGDLLLDDYEQQEYSDGSLRYQDEYLENLESNLANYDSQYYSDDDEVMLTKNDEVEELSQS